MIFDVQTKDDFVELDLIYVDAFVAEGWWQRTYELCKLHGRHVVLS